MLGEFETAPHRDGLVSGASPQTAQALALAIAGFAVLYAAIIAPQLVAGAPAAAAATALLAAALIALSAFDITTLRLPDAITLPLIVAGIVLAPADAVAWRAVSAIAGGGALLAIAMIYRRLRHRDGLGLGDVKLVAAAGAWVGLENLSGVVLIACGVAMIVLCAMAVLSRKIKSTDVIPFGPFLALGLWIVWLYNPIAFLAL